MSLFESTCKECYEALTRQDRRETTVVRGDYHHVVATLKVPLLILIKRLQSLHAAAFVTRHQLSVKVVHIGGFTVCPSLTNTSQLA